AYGRAKMAALAASSEPLDVSMVEEDSEAMGQLARELRQQAAEPAQPASPAEEAKKEELESIKAPGQVVDVPKPTEEKVPKTAKYVSEYNTTTEKELKSRSNGKPGAAPGPKA